MATAPLGRPFVHGQLNGSWVGWVTADGELEGDWLDSRGGYAIASDEKGRFLLRGLIDSVEIWDLSAPPKRLLELPDIAPAMLLTSSGFLFLGNAPDQRLDQVRVAGPEHLIGQTVSFGADSLDSAGVDTLLTLDHGARILAAGYGAGRRRHESVRPIRVLRETHTDRGFELETETTLGPTNIDDGLGNDVAASGGHRAMLGWVGSELWVLTSTSTGLAISVLDLGYFPRAATIAPDGKIAAVSIQVSEGTPYSFLLVDLDRFEVTHHTEFDEPHGPDAQLARTREGYVLHAMYGKDWRCYREVDDCPDFIAQRYDRVGRPSGPPTLVKLPDPPGGGRRPERATQAYPPAPR